MNAKINTIHPNIRGFIKSLPYFTFVKVKNYALQNINFNRYFVKSFHFSLIWAKNHKFNATTPYPPKKKGGC